MTTLELMPQFKVSLTVFISLLGSSIMLQESSITLLENIYSTVITLDNCNMFIVQATGANAV
jgi:hypothetical protein